MPDCVSALDAARRARRPVTVVHDHCQAVAFADGPTSTEPPRTTPWLAVFGRSCLLRAPTCLQRRDHARDTRATVTSCRGCHSGGVVWVARP